jgi:hypothetical protein
VSGGRRAFRKFLATTVAASVALGSPTLIGGCSFMAVQSPRKDERGRLEPAGCTTRMVAPAADGVITGALLVGTLMTAGSAEDTPQVPKGGAETQIMVGAVLAALYGISALYGAATVGNCRVASGMGTDPKVTNDERRSQRRTEEAAEEAAVQARLKAQAAADASAAAGAATDAGAQPDGSAPATAPNQKQDDER